MKYILYWRDWRKRSNGWCYGGTYATKTMALENAKRELSGPFDYRIEHCGEIIEQGSARGLLARKGRTA